ncbi:MAG TPA: hypothetical protein VKV19_17330 [Ktedonobacteraceae bacterium]|nr:hypothetical protein [Ktedonobacteraceae bacterium]
MWPDAILNLHMITGTLAGIAGQAAAADLRSPVLAKGSGASPGLGSLCLNL